MILLRTAPQLLASLGLALAVAATPLAISSHSGLTSAQALAKEAESGSKKEVGDDKGGRNGAEKGDDKGGERGGKRGNDDHPGSHSQNGKNR